MAKETIALTPEVRIEINGETVGALQSFREVTGRTLRPIRQLGSDNLLGFYAEKTGFTVTIGFLLTAGLTLTDAQRLLHTLSNFTLGICFSDHTLSFSGCEYASLETSCSVGGSLLCQAEIHALRRSCIYRTAEEVE